MLTDLLEELAREAPTGGAPPGQLWRRGRRVARTRRVGTVAIASIACLLLVALGSATWQQRAVEVPATDAETGSFLPSQFHKPSPYLPGTDSIGPMGTLIAMVAAPRKGWFGSTEGLVGVSAQTGAYAFLDLPDAASGFLREAALAPDGRHIAYWTTGHVPNPVPDREGDTINGYAVYDTVTGEVVSQKPSTERGIGHGVFVWFDPTHLGVDFGQMQDCCGSTDHRAMVFDLDSAEQVDLSTDIDLDGAGTNGVGSVITVNDDAVIVQVDGSTRSVEARQTAPRINSSQSVAMTPDSKRVAAIIGDGAPGRIGVKRVNDDGNGDPIPGTFSGVIGWLDDTHLAALEPRGDNNPTFDLVSVDVRDGSTEMLSRSLDMFGVAINLLGSPVRDQPSPPHPWSPWIPAVAAAATVAIAAWALFVWRRRASV
ncbi:hypothetical protein ABTZ46_22615 [Nocardioides sp. NPDC126508]